MITVMSVQWLGVPSRGEESGVRSPVRRRERGRTEERDGRRRVQILTSVPPLPTVQVCHTGRSGHGRRQKGRR